jgi:hypothetical protein
MGEFRVAAGGAPGKAFEQKPWREELEREFDAGAYASAYGDPVVVIYWNVELGQSGRFQSYELSLTRRDLIEMLLSIEEVSEKRQRDKVAVSR